MPSRLKPVSVRAFQGLQVSSLLVWTGGIAEVSLFCASEVNSPLANHCTQEEGLSPGCAIAPPWRTFRKYVARPSPPEILIPLAGGGSLAEVFLKSCPGDLDMDQS